MKSGDLDAFALPIDFEVTLSGARGTTRFSTMIYSSNHPKAEEMSLGASIFIPISEFSLIRTLIDGLVEHSSRIASATAETEELAWKHFTNEMLKFFHWEYEGMNANDDYVEKQKIGIKK